MQSFQLRLLIYSCPWSFLQHIHTSSFNCLSRQLPILSIDTGFLLLAATSTEQGPLTTFLTPAHNRQRGNWSDIDWTYIMFFLFCFLLHALVHNSCFSGMQFDYMVTFNQTSTTVKSLEVVLLGKHVFYVFSSLSVCKSKPMCKESCSWH